MVDAVRSSNWRVSRSRVGARKLLNWAASVTSILPSVAQSGTPAAQSVKDSPEARSSIIRVDATPGHVINSFDPDRALGSSIDVLSHDGIDKVATTVKGESGTIFTLPKASITVLRGKVGALMD